MQRIFGALAVFGGWLCILLSALLGLVATEFLGLNHIEGDLPPSGIYGVPAVIVLWTVIAIAILTIVPVAGAIFAPDPRRPLNWAAWTMAIVGFAMLPDELGRAYAAAILPGAALLAVGGRLIHEAGPIDTTAGERAAPEPATVAAPAPEPVMATEPAQATEPARATKRSTRKPAGDAGGPSAQPDGPACPWCSAGIPAGAERCPNCGATMKPGQVAETVAIPGLTAVSPELRDYADRVARQKKRPGLRSLIFDEGDDRVMTTAGGGVDPSVFKPPSDEVRAEMERLDREIAAGTQAATAAAAPSQPSPESTADATPGSTASADAAETPASGRRRGNPGS
jgi:hypothetical protein